MQEVNVEELTQSLIQLRTINPPGQEAEAARFLGELLAKAGFEVRYHEFAPGRMNLIAFSPGKTGAPLLCLSGHLDTVPLGSASWEHDPFSGAVGDGRIFGRGASDMKGGVAAMVVAALRAVERASDERRLILVFTGGEETGCIGAESLARSGWLPQQADALIVGEPTSNYPVLGHKGAFWVEAVTRGLAAHGAMPDKGINAVYKAAHAVLKLKAYDFHCDPHPVLGGPTINVGTISGGTNINSVPDEARIGIDIRTIPGIDHDKLLADLGDYLGDDVELRPLVDAAGVWSDPNHPWVSYVFDIAGRILGEIPAPRSVSYFTDASTLKKALGHPPTLILGPGEAELAHQADEYCRIDRLRQAVEIYQEIAMSWLKTQKDDAAIFGQG